MSTLLACTLVQWLQVYNERATEFVAHLLRVTHPDSIPRKCLTLVTPAGIYVRIIYIEETTTVAAIVTFGEQLYRAGDYSSPLESTLRVWDHVEDGDQLVYRGYIFKGIRDCSCNVNGYVISVSWHPNGQWIACGYTSGWIYIFDIDANKRIAFMYAHSESVTSLSWDPLEQWLASGSNDGTLRIWDTKTWNRTRVLTPRHSYFQTALHPSGKWIIVSDIHGAALWDIVTWKCVNGIELKCPDGVSRCNIEWHPTKNQIAHSLGTTIEILDMEPLYCDRILDNHTGFVTAIRWHPSGKWLASASNDKTIRIWDMVGTNTPQIIQAHNHAYVWDLDWNVDGTRLVSVIGGSVIQIWK